MGSSGFDVSAELLQRVPPEARALVGQLMDEPLLSSRVLRGEVDAHEQLFRDAQRGNEFLDLEQAQTLARQCRELLDAVGDDASEQRRRLVQVAVRYFVIEADGDDDLGIGGLDDDEAVLAAVEDLLASTIDKTSD